jgi:hypothetical protein
MTAIEPPEPRPSGPDLTNLYVHRGTGYLSLFENGSPVEPTYEPSGTQVGLCMICLQETSRPHKYGSYLGSNCSLHNREHFERYGKATDIVGNPFRAAHAKRPVILVMRAWQVYCLREYTQGISEPYVPITEVFERARAAGDSQWHFKRAVPWIRKKHREVSSLLRGSSQKSFEEKISLVIKGLPKFEPYMAPKEAIAFMMGKSVEDVEFPSSHPDDADDLKE